MCPPGLGFDSFCCEKGIRFEEEKGFEHDMFLSLQCRGILRAQVYIFKLGHHLGFSYCGGLQQGQGKICQESRCEVKK